MSPRDKAEALVEIARLESQAASLRLSVMVQADDLAAETGAKDAAAWMATRTHAEYQAQRADLELADGLDRRWRHLGVALVAGHASVAQARVIAAALEALPEDLPADVVQRAETTLTAYAADYRPAQLWRIGRKILEVVAPELAEAEEAKRLREEEQRARAQTYFTRKSLGNGRTRIVGELADADAARLWTYLESFASPRRQGPSDTAAGEERVPHRRRLGEAFVALLEHLDPRKLPQHGGVPTTVMVTVSLDQLRTDLGVAGLIDGDLSQGFNLTADEARRLACTAGIIPVVLGGKGEILNEGRARRLFTPAQMKAMRLRDKECRAAGCTVPATWCEGHHGRAWSRGGRTDLADGALLCPWHHHRAHDPTYLTERLPNGDYRFTRRT